MRRRSPDLNTRDPDLAGVARIRAGEDLHERGLAGAVLADQPDDLAARHRQVDPAQGVHPGKPFVDAAQVEHGRVVAGHAPPPDRCA
jgi:hypothetical protein